VLGRDVGWIYGGWDDSFQGGAADTAEDDFVIYRTECAAADAAVADLSLEFEFLRGDTGTPMSLRWVYVHMIEEYARHNGHADLIRQAIDGAIGE
jgi:hypothetical protein